MEFVGQSYMAWINLSIPIQVFKFNIGSATSVLLSCNLNDDTSWVGWEICELLPSGENLAATPSRGFYSGLSIDSPHLQPSFSFALALWRFFVTFNVDSFYTIYFHSNSWQGRTEQEKCKTLATCCKKIEKHPCFLIPWLSHWVCEYSGDGGGVLLTKRPASHSLFLALLRRPLWRRNNGPLGQAPFCQ